MEEKILIKSEKYNVNKTIKIMVIIGAIVSVLMLFSALYSSISWNASEYDGYYEIYLKHNGNCGWPYYDELCYDCGVIKHHTSKLSYVLWELFNYTLAPSRNGEIYLTLIPFGCLSLIGGLIYFWLHSYELTVTDKRIYGKVAWGKRVDLPVDSISATATIKTLKGVSVSTSSGKIKFLVMKNADKIYNVINELLINRQQEKVVATPVVTNTPVSDEADQLKKFKDLLDNGIITQEEFDAKKKQLLGL